MIRALTARVTDDEQSEVRAALSPEEYQLFRAMDVVDQRHALDTAEHCSTMATGDDLLNKAALLHDCGKRRGEAKLWGRIFAVLSQAVAPDWSRRIGQQSQLTSASPWRRALALRYQHAEVGAQRLEEISAQQDLIWLVRHHHTELPPDEGNPSLVERLKLLQQADDQS